MKYQFITKSNRQYFNTEVDALKIIPQESNTGNLEDDLLTLMTLYFKPKFLINLYYQACKNYWYLKKLIIIMISIYMNSYDVTHYLFIYIVFRFSHRSNKTYMCDDCGKVLKSRTALATHVKLHQDDTRNQCSICFKIFSQRGYLKTHMNSHSDSKPYSCEFCAMTFFGPTNLSQHRKRTHGDMIGESPKLSCDLCTKRFWIPSELKYHRERVHEGKKDFSCTECQKRFADKKNLKKHLVNVHKSRLQHYHH